LKVLILDNASPIPVAETLGQVCSPEDLNSVRVVRNPFNVGANANILRCFEYCDTDYIWVMGDDDCVEPEAIDRIFAELEHYPDTSLLMFSYFAPVAPAPVVVRGFEGLVGHIQSYADLLYIANAIYRVADVRPNLRIGYNYIYSHGPHLALSITSLDSTRTVRFAPGRLIAEMIDHGAERWSRLSLALGITSLFELNMSPTCRDALARLISWQSPLEAQFLELLLTYSLGGNRRLGLYFFQQLRARLYFFDSRPVTKVKLLVFGILLRMPNLAEKFLLLAIRIFGEQKVLRGKTMKDLRIDRYARM
jgi:hypothetical protein